MRRRYLMIDGELVEVGRDFRQERPATTSHNIIPDIKPYQSMIDGSEIGSRSTHRAHLRAHGCVEVGNEPAFCNPQYKPLESPPGLKELIINVAADKLRY